MNVGLADKVMLFVYMILEVTCFKQLAGLILYPNLKLSEQRFVVVVLTLCCFNTVHKKKKKIQSCNSLMLNLVSQEKTPLLG